MITLFCILMVLVFGRLIVLAFQAAWGLTKILFGFIFSPLILIMLVFCGMMYLAVPILVIAAIALLIGALVK